MIRHAFQAELYGLTPAQRTATVTQVTNALAGREVVESSTVVIQSRRGDQYVLVEATFTTKSDGDALFDTARTRAISVGAGVGALSGRASYVRLISNDFDARTMTTRYAEATGWVESTVVSPLDTLRAE